MIDPVPRRLARLVFVIACAFLATSCDGLTADMDTDRDREIEILIHPDAIETKLYPGEYPIPTGLEYKVNMSYPAMAIDVQRQNALINLGWKECRSRSNTWEIFVDKRQADNPHCRYQEIRYLVKGNSFMAITLSYTDNFTENTYCSKTPTNTLQTASVTIFDNIEVERKIKWLGLTCDP